MEESNGLAFDGDYIDKKDDVFKEHFIARHYDPAVKKANFILDNTIALLRSQGKGPATKSEKAYLDTVRSNCVKLFILAHQLIPTKCKHDDQGRWVYEPRPIAGPDLQCTGCYKVHMATVRLTSIYNPQIGGKFTETSGGLTNLFYCCKH